MRYATRSLLLALLLSCPASARAADPAVGWPMLVRPDAPLQVQGMTPPETLWFGRLTRGMTASQTLADNMMKSGDTYTVGRDGGNYTEALLMALRATGDRRFLDRTLDLANLAKAQLRDAWRDGTTDGYTSWLWLYDSTNATYYGKDTNWLDESISSGNAALWMYAFHQNRALDPKFAAAADFWRGWLETQFLAKWYSRAGGDSLAAWNTPYVAFYKPDCEPRSANWRLAYYLWKVGGNPFYRDRAEQIRQQLAGAQVINPAHPTAYRWAKELDPGTQSWMLTNYAQYYMRVVIEMNLEGVAGYSSPVEMKRFASTFRDVVYAGNATSLSTMPNDVNGGGSTGFALYAYNAFAPWDSTGYLMNLADRSISTSYAGGGLSKAARNDVYVSAYALLALSPMGTTATMVSSFSANPQDDGRVRIEFTLGSRDPSTRTAVYRLSADGLTRTRVDTSPLVGPGPNVVFDTPPADATALTYVLTDMGTAGEPEIGRIDVNFARKVTAFTLGATAPNPFSDHTTLRLSVARPDHVRIEVSDVAGRRVRLLREGTFATGEYAVAWDGRDDRGAQVPSGVYFYSARTSAGVQVRRALRVP